MVAVASLRGRVGCVFCLALGVSLAGTRTARGDTALHSVVAVGQVTEEGYEFPSLGALHYVLGPEGRVAFYVTANLDGVSRSTLWLYENGRTLLVFDRSIEPGIDPAFGLPSLADRHIDSRGVVTALLLYSTDNSTSVFRKRPGGVGQLIGKGDPIPGAVSGSYEGASFQSFPEVEKMLITEYARDAIARSSLVESGDTLQPFLSVGDPVPGSSGKTFTSAPYVYSITTKGRVLFEASTSDTETGNFFSATNKSDIASVLRIATAPTPFAGEFFSIDSAHLSDAGDLALVVSGQDPALGFDEKGLWYGRPNALKLIARSAAPSERVDAATLGTDVITGVKGDVQFSPSGNVALLAKKDVFSVPRLWVGKPDALEPILDTEGGAVPGLPGVTCLAIDEFHINDRGQVAMIAALSVGQAIVRYSPGGVFEVLAVGGGKPLTVDGTSKPLALVTDSRLSQDGRVAFFALRPGTAEQYDQVLIISDPLDASGSADGGVAGASGDAGNGGAEGGSAGATAADGGSAEEAGDAAGKAQASGGSANNLAGAGATGVRGTRDDGGGCSVGHRSRSAPLTALLSALALLALRRRRQPR